MMQTAAIAGVLAALVARPCRAAATRRTRSRSPPASAATGTRSIAEIGQRAGIFKKHGLVLEILWTQGGGETQQAVISGSVDIGVAPGIMGVLSAFSKGAPVRIIGAETTGASDLYWYVPASSPIKSLKDTDGKTIAYSTNGSSTHGIVTAFMKQYDLKAKPTATGGPAPTLTQVMSEPDRRRLVGAAVRPAAAGRRQDPDHRAAATTPPCSRARPVRLLDHQRADAARRARRSIDRFMKAYRETIDWLYSDDPGGAQDLRRFRRHPGRDGQAHARRFLSRRRRSIPTRSSDSTRSCRTPSRSSSPRRRSRRSSSPS